MTSAGTFSNRLSEIDELTRPDHTYLTETDKCYFLGEYTARRGYSYSETNNLISNLKKGIERRDLPEWRYKERAIRQAAQAFRQALAPADLNRLTFMPIPPSKARDHQHYDDRLPRMLAAIRQEPPLDIRELIVQTESTEAAHLIDARPRPEDIEAIYRIDPDAAEPTPVSIAIVDDLLTTGAHFRAAKAILSNHFPQVPVVGLFIARRAPGTTIPENLPRFQL